MGSKVAESWDLLTPPPKYQRNTSSLRAVSRAKKERTQQTKRAHCQRGNGRRIHDGSCRCIGTRHLPVQMLRAASLIHLLVAGPCRIVPEQDARLEHCTVPIASPPRRPGAWLWIPCVQGQLNLGVARWRS